ncbi:MAG TPA: cupredoxin domain-containing protein [Acidimicrobiia bacterium]
MARQRHVTLRRLLIGGATLLLGCALGGGIAFAAGSTTARAGTATVHLGDNFFQPDHLTVSVGTKVTFTWTGSNTHNVTVVSGPQKFHSTDQASGSYSRVMTKAGVYHIVCTFHPGMNLTLTVRKAKTPRATTTTAASPPSS